MSRRPGGRKPFVLALLLGAAGLPAAAFELDNLSRVFDSRRSSDTASGASRVTSISSNGRYVVFLSEAGNLVPGQIDENYRDDVFLRDELTGTTVLVSRSADSPVTAGDHISMDAVISGDGRYVAFVSRARDLVTGQVDSSDQPDIFLFDRITRTTALVSHSAASQRAVGNGYCDAPAVSADGKYVAFASFATNLVSGQRDNNFAPDVFLWERLTGKITLVSHAASSATRAADQHSGAPSISGDGRFLAFESAGSRLVPGQTGLQGNVFLFDRTSGQNLLVSRAGNQRVGAGGGAPALSANGESVAFLSTAGNLVPAQTGPPHQANVFVFHRSSGRMTLVSHASSSSTSTADASSAPPRISADGAWVAFGSHSTNLVPGQVDTAASSDVFLWERASGKIRLVSRNLRSAVVSAEGNSTLAGLSGDGRKILLLSDATDLVAPFEPGGNLNVYLADRSGAVVLASSAGQAAGNGTARGGVLSRDGNWIAFTSEATDLEPDARDLNAGTDVFLYGRAAADLKLLTRRDAESPPWTTGGLAGNLSADGRFAVFVAASPDILPDVLDENGGGDVFLYDRVGKTSTLVSHSLAGPRVAGNAVSWDAQISSDGRYVIYFSDSTDLAPGPTEGAGALFLYDRTSGQNTLISRSVGWPGTAVASPAISADGSTVAFVSRARDLIPGQAYYPNRSFSNVFLYDTASRVLTMASHALGLTHQSGRGDSDLGAISADGKYLVVRSDATDLIAGLPSGTPDLLEPPLYLYDKVARTMTLITRPNAPGAPLEGGGDTRISADGRFVAFTSSGGALVPGQIESGAFDSMDVFLWDRETATTRLISHLPDNPVAAAGSSFASGLAMSADGGWVAFPGRGNLVSGYRGPDAGLILLYERSSDTNRLVGSPQGEDSFESSLPDMSPDGRYVAFSSGGRPSPEPIGTTTFNVFLFDRTTGSTTLVSRSPRAPFPSGNGPSGARTFGGLVEVSNHGIVLFESVATNLAVGDYNLLVDVFLFAP